MNKIRNIDCENMLVTVEPGITRKEVNEALRDTGLFFSVDPGANASIGGMAATRASGTTTVRYGTMRDAVKALEVVLADGRTIKTGTYAKKTSAGYDLTALMVGSEGTLGLITELTLKLHPIPEAISAGIVAFESFGGAVQSVIETIQMALPMARIEFVDTATVQAFNAYADRNIPAMPHLLFELHGSEDSVKQDAETFGAICRENGGQDFEWSERTEDRTALWSLRHNGYYAILAARKGARAVVTDICVPISHLADAVEETRADIAASGLMGPILGHVGDGNFHSVLLLDPENKAEHETALVLSDRMAQRALAYGGTCTGEHGVGIGKKKFMEAEHGTAWDVMGTIKQALDPHNLMNPGKLVRD
jgi:D-lactate dehydrogenase (cytochrome)